MNKNWLKVTDPQPFKDIAIFSADFWGHSYWSLRDDELLFILHLVDKHYLPEYLCEVGPDEAAQLRGLIDKYGYDKENYVAVLNWARERDAK